MDFQNILNQHILNNTLLDLHKKIGEIIRKIEIIFIKLEILYDYLNIKQEVLINFSNKILNVNINLEVEFYKWNSFEILADILKLKYELKKKEYRELKHELFILSKKYNVQVYDEDDSPEYGLELFYENYGKKKIVIEI